MAELEERNRNVVRRFVTAMSEGRRSDSLSEFLAPRFRLVRNAFHHLTANAQAHALGDSAEPLHQGFLGHVDNFDMIVAEGYRVAIRWQTSGVHDHACFGIAPTGRPYRIWQAALFHLAEGRITEGWFMAEELAFLLDLRVGLPRGQGGADYRPSALIGRAAPEAYWEALRALPAPSLEERNKIALLDHKVARLRLKSEDIPAFEAARKPRPKTSGGSRLLHEYGKERGLPYQAPQAGLRDRLDHIDDLIADRDLVFQRYTFSGHHTSEWYGIPPTDRLVGTRELSYQRFENGGNIESWYFVDELGLVLQMNAFELLLAQRCATG